MKEQRKEGEKQEEMMKKGRLEAWEKGRTKEGRKKQRIRDGNRKDARRSRVETGNSAGLALGQVRPVLCVELSEYPPAGIIAGKV